MSDFVSVLPMLLSILSIVGTGVTGVVAFKYSAPEECQWGFLAADTEEVGLVCRVQVLNGDASYSNLSAISGEHTASLRVECIDDVFIQSSLPNGSLEHLTHLRDLRVDNCKLAGLPSLAFAGMNNLRNLSLRTHNDQWPTLSLHMQQNVFTPLRQLERLDLGHNAIWKVPPRVFCPLSNLFSLNLTHNRLQDTAALSFGSRASVTAATGDDIIEDILEHDEAGGSCQLELRELDLSNNDLNTVPAKVFSSLRRLRKLYLHNNEISVVAEMALYNLQVLQVLNLSGNKIVSLPPELLQNVSDLVELYLHNNSLTVLPLGLLTGLQQLLVLDLSHNELTNDWVDGETFEDLIRLVVLNLSNNRMTRVDAITFRNLYSLQVLRLEHNAIEAVADNAFSSMYNLHTLLLSHNQLTHVDAFTLNGLYVLSLLSLDFNRIDNVHPDAFKNCSGLQDLNLHSNSLYEVPEAVRMLQFLKTLDVGQNHISSLFNASFRGLQQLTGLVLMHNNIGNLTRGTFTNMPSLKILNLARNKIQTIDHGTFDGNTNLQAIRLDTNFLTDMNGLFANLPSLIWLNISANHISWFDYALVPLGLQWLDIHSNHISVLGNYFDLEAKLRLQIMDASSNRITEIGAAALPDGIQLLFLNDNRITKVQPFTFLRKHNLSRVDLFGNNIQIMDLSALRLSPWPEDRLLPEFYLGGNPFQCDCNMEWLQRINHLDQLRQHPRVMDLDSIYCRLLYNPDRTYIPLVEAQPSQFLCPYSGHCFTLCQCCEYDACDCEMICPDNCTCYHDQSWSANIVVCTSGNYTSMPEQIPMDATEIYLDGNNLQLLSSHTFIGRKNMRVLFLNNSNIQGINNRTFNGLKKLEVLHLESNLLTELRGYEFERLEDLRELFLQNNRLQVIHNGTFIPLKSLEILQLHGNFIIDLPVWNFNVNLKLWELTLGGNPWSCDCHFLDEFHAWLVTSQDRVRDAKQIRCGARRNDTGAYLLTHNSSVCDNATATSVAQSRPLQDYLPALVIGIGVFAAVVLIVLLIVIFRNEMRLWVFSRYGVRLFARHDADADETKLFDAFVSYSSKDENFVAHVLAPELECGRLQYTLCLHYRDFPVGSYVSDTIVEAVESSHRTILVLSENFIKSEWCRFEFKSAYHQALKDRRRRLIVILLGEIAQRDLDPDIRLYLKTNTYLQWGDKLFWEKLRYALPPVHHHNHHSQQQQQQQQHPQHNGKKEQQQQQHGSTCCGSRDSNNASVRSAAIHI